MPTTIELPLSSPASSSAANRGARTDSTLCEIADIKTQLLKAEIRLAKSRAHAAGAEADVKVLSARLREISK